MKDVEVKKGGFWKTPGGVYDFTRPADNVEAFVRVHADAAGRLSYLYGQGSVFAALEGEPLPIRLCDFEVLRVNRFLPFEDRGYRHIYTWSMYLTDHQSGEPLSVLKNPLNGKEGVPELASPRVVQRVLLEEGVRFFEEDGSVGDRNPYSNNHLDPFILDWSAVKDTVWFHIQTPFEMRGASWNDSWLYTLSLEELENRDLTSVRTQHSCSVNSSLYPWMNFDRPGFLRWFRYGSKCGDPAELPRRQYENVIAREPDFFDRCERLGED